MTIFYYAVFLPVLVLVSTFAVVLLVWYGGRHVIRALVFNPEVLLVLDEATSSIDSEIEALIQDALVKIMEKRTTIIIAHRLSTIKNVDKIIVLSHGEIVEKGTHRELLKAKGIYHKLYKYQYQLHK